jgi:hypothetical protein
MDFAIQTVPTYTYNHKNRIYKLFKNPATNKWEVWKESTEHYYVGCWAKKATAKSFIDNL